MNVQDRRRLLGPADAKPIEFSTSVVQTTDSTVKPPAASDGEKETVVFHTGLIENCNGSSLVEVKDLHHQTSLITSVYGPRALRGSFTSQASLSIQLKNGSLEKYSTAQLKEVANFLTGIFNSVVNRSRYPKSGIDIFLYLTYDKDLDQNLNFTNRTTNISAIIPHCITGITLALVDASIEVLDMASGGSCNGNVFSFIKNGDEITGFWKDEGERDQIMESLESCKEKYLNYKNLMISYLMQKSETDKTIEKA